MPAWSEQNITLLGGAVHGMAPNLAQDACLSIEDAMEQAHQLHHVHDVESTECKPIEGSRIT